MFAHHLQLESRSTLSLTCLPPSSPQYVRCVKAVHDNLGTQVGGVDLPPGRVRPDSVRVLNVFKVKNAYLSKALQVLHTYDDYYWINLVVFYMHTA